HYGHPSSQLEWWYYSALVTDSSGTHYSVFFTLFSVFGFLEAPVAQVMNLDTGELVGHSEGLGLGGPSPSAVDVNVPGARLVYQQRTDTWSFAVSSWGLRVSLSQQPEKPYALHGGGAGVIQQSVAGISHYYSATRMRASGTLRVGGRTVPVR